MNLIGLMKMECYKCRFILIGVLALSGLQGINTQKSETPEVLDMNFDPSVIPSLGQNLRVVEVEDANDNTHTVESLDDETVESDIPTEIIQRIFKKSYINNRLESASKVVLPSSKNHTANDVYYELKKNASESKSPTKHIVQDLNSKEAEDAIMHVEKVSEKNSKAKYDAATGALIPENPTVHKVQTLDVRDIDLLLKNDKSKVKYDEVTGELIDPHPCQRECREGEEPMICFYSFKIEWYHSMSKACYSCPYVESDCFRKDCIPVDGKSRSLTVVNRKMPGPLVDVCLGDRVIVDVENDLMTEGTSVHWHGMHQKRTPFMDGTPFVTQCPISPGATFRYQFNASHAGTHFWHSHSGMQRADGAAGPFIVRRPRSQDPHSSLYDYDRTNHIMLVQDWIHELSISMFTDHHHSEGDNKPPTLIINGLGRFQIFNETTKPFYMRTARYNVEQGFRYRFRVINAEFLNCPIEMTIDGHNITVINSDGYDLQPMTATSLVTYAGERYDFIVEANNEIDNYWIRFRGLMDCDERFTKAKQVAVLHYDGAMETEPSGDPSWEQMHNEGLQLNALNKGEEENETISVAEMRSLDEYDESLKEIADYQFYVAYDFYAKNNSHFHKSPYYGYYQVPKKDNRLYTPQLNHISMQMPASPLLLARPSPEGFCNSSSIQEDCKEGYCQCPHVLSVRLNSIVEVIIVDEGVTFDANHPFHLHGHAFRVVGMRRLANETTIEDVKAFDEAGLLKRNLRNAPIKDTVTVPDGGYTVLRFKADNPGYWLFHCHLEFHVEIGMALVFKVGEHKDMPAIPHHFPTCGNYLPDNMLEDHTEKPKNVININHWWPVVYVNGTNSASNLSNACKILVSMCALLLRL